MLQIGRPNMTKLVIGLTVIWLLGITIFAGRFLNFTRLLYNNLDPTKDLSKSGMFTNTSSINWTGTQSIDPANLTELGRQYQQQAIRDEWRAMVWGLGGLAILTCMLAPSEDKLVIGILAAVLAGFYFWARRIRLGKATKIESTLAGGLDALTFLLPK